MKKKILALCVVVSMLALAIAGGTLAYFTETATEDNVFVIGNIDIKLWESNGENVNNNGEQNNTDYEDWLEEQVIYPGRIVNKNVWVENVGVHEAYARVIIFVPAGLVPNWDASVGTTWIMASEKDATVDGVAGTEYVLEYNGKLAGATATATTRTPNCLESVTIDPFLDYNENGPITQDTLELTVKVTAQAIQTYGFANAKAALAALDAQLAVNNGGTTAKTEIEAPVLSDNATEAEKKAAQEAVNDAFEDAVTEDVTFITVDLSTDVTYDVAAWAANGMGSDKTERIVINGNGHTITFYQTNSDWNNIVTNGAVLEINNAKITNAGRNDGPWNRHDLNFACDVVLNDVTSDKAMAFKAGAVLKNVTIDDANTSDTYAIWIQPNGQTVTLDGCTIDMLDCTDGRGIKIDEQYIGAPEKVVLSVSSTTFKTEEKSAILVKSAAGADITLNNVDITAVAADSTNAVWVDEASASYADLVTVTGGTKILEP